MDRADEDGASLAGVDGEAADADVLSLLDPAVREWWVDRFGAFVPENGGFFTPPQREAIPLVHDDENALVCAPTGSGKTLASFTAIINELFRRERAGGLENAVYCLYVSPLKALANDVHRNLAEPLDGIRDRLAAESCSRLPRATLAVEEVCRPNRTTIACLPRGAHQDPSAGGGDSDRASKPCVRATCCR